MFRVRFFQLVPSHKDEGVLRTEKAPVQPKEPRTTEFKPVPPKQEARHPCTGVDGMMTT